MNKKVLILIVVLAVIAAGAVIWKAKRVPVKPINPGNQGQSSQPKVEVTAIDPTKLPQGLPSDLPMESGAQVLQNFEAKDPVSGKTQASRAYVSKKTLDEVFASYQSYLQKNGWSVQSTINQPGLKNISALKDNTRLSVTIAKDAEGRNTVNVGYVY